MSSIKKELVAQDLQRVKQILTFVEEGVTNEIGRIATDIGQMEARSEYILMKEFFRPLVSEAAAGEVEGGSLSKSQSAIEKQTAKVEVEIARARDTLEATVFTPQMNTLKQMNLKVVLK